MDSRWIRYPPISRVDNALAAGAQRGARRAPHVDDVGVVLARPPMHRDVGLGTVIPLDLLLQGENPVAHPAAHDVTPVRLKAGKMAVKTSNQHDIGQF